MSARRKVSRQTSEKLKTLTGIISSSCCTLAPSSNGYYQPSHPLTTSNAPSLLPVTASPTPKTKAPIESPVYTEAPVYTKSPVAAPIYPESPNLPPEQGKPISPVYTDSIPTVSPSYTSVPVSTNATTSPEPSESPTSSQSFPPTLLPTTANPVSLSPVTSPSFIPTLPPTTAVPVNIGPTQTAFPSTSPSIMPSSTPATVFINEIGTFNDTQFIEVVYSTFLGSGIINYTIYFYGEKGMVLDSEHLPEGINNVNGMSFTFINYPKTTEIVEAVALVNDVSQEVLNFVSMGEVVHAVNGPAKGMNSTDIMKDQGSTRDEKGIERIISSRLLESGANMTFDSSVSLVGAGCQFGEFTFAETTPTPGSVNSGQEITGCLGGPSAAPSIPIGGTGGITTGAIVGISVSSALLLIILLFTLRGREPPIEEDEEFVTFEFGQESLDIAAGEDLMADTGEIEGDIPVSSTEATAKTSASWWNSVYWVSGASGADKPQQVESTDVPSDSLNMPPAETPETTIMGQVAAGLAVGTAVTEVADPKAKQKTKQNWFFTRSSENKPTPAEDVELPTEDIGATMTDVTPTQEAEPTDTLAQEVNVLPAKASDTTDVLSVRAGVVAGTSAAAADSKKRWLFGRSSGRKSAHAEEADLLAEDIGVTSDGTGPTQEVESIAMLASPELSATPLGSESIEGDATGLVMRAAGAEVVNPTANQKKDKKQNRFFGRSPAKASAPAGEVKCIKEDIGPTTDVAVPTREADSTIMFQSPDLSFSPEAGTATANVQQVAVGMAIGTVRGDEIETTKRKKTRGRIFGRIAKKAFSLPGKAKPPAETEFLREETGTATSVNVPSVIPSPLKANSPASIALSRRDDDSDAEMVSMTSGGVTTETLENLDSALERHDWNAIYNITKRIGKADDSGTRAIDFESGTRGVPKAVSAAVPSDSESDLSESDADQLGLDSSHRSGKFAS